MNHLLSLALVSLLAALPTRPGSPPSASITVTPQKPAYTFTSGGGADTINLSSSVPGGAVGLYSYRWRATKLSEAGDPLGSPLELGDAPFAVWALSGDDAHAFLFSEQTAPCQTSAGQRVRFDLTVAGSRATPVMERLGSALARFTASAEVRIVCPPG